MILTKDTWFGSTNNFTFVSSFLMMVVPTAIPAGKIVSFPDVKIVIPFSGMKDSGKYIKFGFFSPVPTRIA